MNHNEETGMGSKWPSGLFGTQSHAHLVQPLKGHWLKEVLHQGRAWEKEGFGGRGVNSNSKN